MRPAERPSKTKGRTNEKAKSREEDRQNKSFSLEKQIRNTDAWREARQNEAFRRNEQIRHSGHARNRQNEHISREEHISNSVCVCWRGQV